MLLDSNEESVIQKEIEKLLAKFIDVVLAKIPPGLPLIRDTQHAIDFFLGAAVLSNRLIGCMSPTKHSKVQRQVKELLTKGLIREIVSPFGR